jgi:hypothetical protein
MENLLALGRGNSTSCLTNEPPRQMFPAPDKSLRKKGIDLPGKWD